MNRRLQSSPLRLVLRVLLVDRLARFYCDDAIDLHRRGIDFADALHCTTSSGREAFVSFDGHLVRSGAKAGSPLPMKLPA